MEGLKTKETILKDNLLETGDQNIKKNVGDRWGQFNTEVSTKAIYAAMNEYSKQQIISFQKWTSLNGWFWAPNRWMDYNGEPNPTSTEDLYEKFLSTL